MRIRITHMDFNNNRIGLELHPDACQGMLEQLGAFLVDCRACRFTNIFVSCRPGMTNLQMLILEELASRNGATIADAADPPAIHPQPENVTSICAEPSSLGTPFGTVEYELRFVDMTKAVERCAVAGVLIGIASDLDETSKAHLRLCIYELAVNTVEHGQIVPDSTEISMSIQVSDGITAVSYRDNTELFATTGHHKIDMTEKVHNRDKRGLGLFMVNKLVDRIDYERRDDWNVTSMSILNRSDEPTKRRRKPIMEGLAVTMVPCELPNTAVLKPAGTIDSSTAHVLESHFEKLIDRKQTKIVVDFSEVDFISSAGVGIFLGTVSTLRAVGGDLYLMALPKHIEEVFEIINVRSFFVTVDDLDEVASAPQMQE